jgi:hypothetical protein
VELLKVCPVSFLEERTLSVAGLPFYTNWRTAIPVREAAKKYRKCRAVSLAGYPLILRFAGGFSQAAGFDLSF